MASFSVPYAKICPLNRRIGSVHGISTQRWQQLQSNNISFHSNASQKQSSIWRMHATNNEIVSNCTPMPFGVISDIMGKASGLFKLVDTKDLTVVNMNLDCGIDIGKKEVVLLKSTLAGTFRRSPEPCKPPYVKVGDTVAKDQIVCIIESPAIEPETSETTTEILVEDGKPVSVGTVPFSLSLKIKIPSETSGTIFEILVEDGKPVCVDTPLFVIVPSNKTPYCYC